MLQTLISVPRPQALAEALAEHWDLPRPTATLIKHSLALTYRIDTDRGAFACRLSDGNLLDTQHQAKQLAQAHADLVAAGAPLPPCESSRTTKLTATLDCPEGPRVAMLTHWIKGEPLSQHRTIDNAALFGHTLADFHAASATLATHTVQAFHHGLNVDRLALACPGVDTHRLQSALDHATRAADNQQQSIIHGDLDSSNAIITDSGIQLLDIECLAIGTPSLDLAAFTTETRQWPWPSQEHVRDAFLTAYGCSLKTRSQNPETNGNTWPLLEAARLAQILARHLDLRERHGVDRLSPGFAHRLITRILVCSENDGIPVSR